MWKWLPQIVIAILTTLAAIVPAIITPDPRIYIPIVVGVVGILTETISIVIKLESASLSDRTLALSEWAKLAVAAQSRISGEHDPIYTSVAQTAMDNTRAILRNLGEGLAAYAYGDSPEIIISSIRTARKFVDSTHDCRIESRRQLWLEDPMQKTYLEQQKRLIEDHGVVIRRILILPRRVQLSSEVLEEVSQIAQRQLSHKVDLHFICEDDLGREWEADVVVIDNARIHVYQLGTVVPFRDVVVSSDEMEIKREREKFTGLQLKSRPWAEFSHVVNAHGSNPS